ncbi:MAG: hypothetical protein A3F73_08025 [Gallionellales bacterium RIFCSPLOWO2_12_FULL_59_22]|nr:MAG: hypothetical protein A3H99_10575 [Gallionellales bacterium RIFCSPLOWO2_02_FULL_59_110]OGT04280.1 MAG: hypothetical protein A2Z65_06085 [Gallionellales bacterium RIFCSPLOWO2_02_58_13]OGT13276.1 MAG: hypothetical protein A3F73_08025 [Gallionellales bacterium RIFCSPLOWO2_12_FULL_59_22]
MALGLKCKKWFCGGILLALAIAVTGCGRLGGSATPDEEPEAVAKRFYELISTSKIEGGTTPASEAYKMIDSKTSNLNVTQFLEIIKHYPPNFAVVVGKAEVKGTQALVPISFKMPSSFGGEYTVQEVLPLNIDPATNTWKIDFTGDTYGMQKDEAIEASQREAPAQKSEAPPGGK